MAGFRTFATGEVLTAANVNDFLMKQSVMVFADAAARTTALGVNVVEGMLTYNLATDALEVFDGTDFVAAGGGGGFNAIQTIIATDAAWPVPTLDDPIAKVTVVGGGGGGGSGSLGGVGGTTTFGVGTAVETSSIGGLGGTSGNGGVAVRLGRPGLTSGNGGMARVIDQNNSGSCASNGGGGVVTVAYLDLSSFTSLSITIGAGGSGEGARGEVIVEYREAL